jgi:iron-sulfur cluster insertion protein
MFLCNERVTFIDVLKVLRYKSLDVFVQMAINVSKRAAAELLKRSKDIFFYCKSGGCNGFEYVLEPYVGKPVDSETQLLPGGASLHTCNQSMFYLLGTEIGWQEDVMGSRFVFLNPNAKSMCGCGSTFST